MKAYSISELRGITKNLDLGTTPTKRTILNVLHQCIKLASEAEYGRLSTPPPRTYEQGAEALAKENEQLRKLLGEAREWIEGAKESAAIDKAFEEGAADMKDRVLAAMNMADLAHREYDETWQYALDAIRALPTQPEGEGE